LGAAREHLEKALVLAQEVGNELLVAGSLHNLGEVATHQGDLPRAEALTREALTMNREMGNRDWEANNLEWLGVIAQKQGDLATAGARFREALKIKREIGAKQGIASALGRLAGLAAPQGQAERAARLFGAEAALREAIGAPVIPVEQAGHQEHLESLRHSLGEDAFAAALGAGRTMSWEETAAYALEQESA
jgi:non-specific serine/threonine protein kinase